MNPARESCKSEPCVFDEGDYRYGFGCNRLQYLRKHTDYLTTESCLSLSDFVLSGLNPNKVRAFLKMVVGPRSEVATVGFYDWEDDWEEE